MSRMMRRADERRRKRVRAEVIASWIIFPIILLICYLIYREVSPVVTKPIGQFMHEVKAKR
jgi:hypothetical protein